MLSSKIIVTIPTYVGTLLFSVTHAHIAHLRTHKFAEHIALQDFYEDMPELIDTLVEKIQSVEMINEYVDMSEYLFLDENFNATQNFTVYLRNLREFVKVCREALFNPEKFSSITSASDDIIDLIDSTLYKLTKLTESKKNK